MSLINQVLQDLDKRGANTNLGEATIRVVHAPSRRSAMLLVVTGAAGMLAVGAAVSLIWQMQQRSGVPAHAVVATPKPAEALPASLPVAAPVLPKAPRIDSVSPPTILASGKIQVITIKGSNFTEGASVTLRKQGGQAYANRPLDTITDNQIVLKANFGKAAGAWTVEVLNPDGSSSGQYAFTVRASEAKAPAANQASLISASLGSEQGRVQHGTAAMGGVNKQPTQITLQQQADTEYRRAYQLMRQGHNNEALAGYENAVKLYPGHDLARQNMVSLLLGKKRNAEAETLLQEGLLLDPQQASFAMLLARLQVERNAVPLALETLQHTLPYAGKQPEYLAFVAALLQRQSRHKEAAEYYRKSLQLNPQSGVWLMGLGISLRAEQRKVEAREAFKRALDTNSLGTELNDFVAQQLKELQS